MSQENIFMKMGEQLLTPTPVQYLGRGPLGQNLYMKRDDLLGFSFGGNKCRIGAVLLEDMEKKGADFLVSYGSKRSNLNRVLATMCKSRKIPCLVICSQEEDEPEEETFNAGMIRRMGIQSVACRKTNVAETVDRVLTQAREEGYTPYYIYGDRYGKGNESVVRQAHQRAFEELAAWEEQHGIWFDRIFLASGTGMTQGGLIAGQEAYARRQSFRQKKAKIIGISVARDQKIGEEAVRRYAGVDADTEIHFLDEYRCGGYGCYDDSTQQVIEQMMEEHGIPLDPTYTGKAYSGMMDMLKKQGTDQDSVLFWHTGGTPLYFDYLRQKAQERRR